jgi:hypothetical protein
MLTGATIAIVSGFLRGELLNFSNQNAITGSYDAATGVLTLSGTDTLADYQTAMRSVTFSNPRPTEIRPATPACRSTGR